MRGLRNPRPRRRSGKDEATSRPISLQPGMAMVLTELATVATQPRRSPFKRLLVSLLILGGVTATVGAGTFASYNGSTKNTSTFATGSIVLGDTATPGAGQDVGAAGQCLSTGSDSIIGNAGTDTAELANNSSMCPVSISLSNAKPGSLATAAFTLVNKGNVTTTTPTLKLYSPGCTDSDGNDQTFYHGTTDILNNVCTYLQMYVEQSGTTACKYGGKGVSMTNSNVARTFPFTLTNNSNERISMTVNGTATANVDIVAANTTWPDTQVGYVGLAASMNAAFAASAVSAIAEVGLDKKIYIQSKVPGTGTIVVNSNGTFNGETVLGFNGANEISTAGGQAAACTFTPVHTVPNFASTFSSTSPMSLTTLAPNASVTYVVGVQLPTGLDGQMQGRRATFDLVWSLS